MRYRLAMLAGRWFSREALLIQSVIVAESRAPPFHRSSPSDLPPLLFYLLWFDVPLGSTGLLTCFLAPLLLLDPHRHPHTRRYPINVYKSSQELHDSEFGKREEIRKIKHTKRLRVGALKA